jgi:RNA polymerase sigma factor (sigma-70 family)
MMNGEQAEPKVSVDADDLVVRAKSDRAAFGLLYERYYPEVSRYCLRRLLIRAVAEDILSDVFIEIASHLPAFSGLTDTDFRRWLFRITTNAINAHLRQSRRRRQLLSEAARCGRLNRNGDSLADNRDWPAISRAIDELDESDQTIVTLRFFSDCSHDEIASVVRSTPGAVRTALSRAIARLREKLKQSTASDSVPGPHQ